MVYGADELELDDDDELLFDELELDELLLDELELDELLLDELELDELELDELELLELLELDEDEDDDVSLTTRKACMVGFHTSLRIAVKSA